tara:strand:+ start:331 stop:924 length:594 start_codon:yes stop_codon:yes gene_type:complete
VISLWVATTNKGKLSEFKNILMNVAELHSPSELSAYTAPKETGTTFVENARIKAKSLHAVTGGWVVADDSGLVVESLGGLPGIHSARYAGEKASDGENISKLLKMMQIRSGGNRKAKFVCAFVAYSPSGEEHVIETEFEGEISQKVSGKSGFGYDPVFIPKGETKTLSDLGAAFKNQHSHRAQAIHALKAVFQSQKD